LNHRRDGHAKDLDELIKGLNGPVRKVSPKFFYDERGSRLFERICELPEYYLTRTELGIMRKYMAEISACCGPRVSVIEFGSGAGLKTRLLLENLPEPVAYVPVEISGSHLEAVAAEFAGEFPLIEILPTIADFTRPFPLPEPKKRPVRNLVYFPGSTIGNFPPEDAVDLLRVMHQEAGPGGALLIGFDLKKDIDTLERAYNDSEGVTAEFNLNLLRRLNREFGFDFDLSGFSHRALYNETRGRIEMHLVSNVAQRVCVDGQKFDFKAGDAIVTEYSYKYDPDQFGAMLAQVGFELVQGWTDPEQRFFIHFCTRG
jgi:dimethylhistidine N-methyltransferase